MDVSQILQLSIFSDAGAFPCIARLSAPGASEPAVSSPESGDDELDVQSNIYRIYNLLGFIQIPSCLHFAGLSTKGYLRVL